MDKGAWLREVCLNLSAGDRDGAIRVAQEWPFDPPSETRTKSRRISEPDAMRVFFRDGFIDRYTGEKVVFPATLKVLGILLPEHIPWHPNSNQRLAHRASLDLWPSVDHVKPIALGGAHEPSNWVTASMSSNMAKGAQTLDALGWKLHSPGDYSDWDGMTDWTLSYVEENQDSFEGDHFISKWCRAAKRILAELRSGD